METVFKGLSICGIASAVPTRWVSVREQFGGDNEETIRAINKFIKSTGIEGRYLASDKQTSSDLCFVAAKRLLEEKKISKDRIGLLLFVSQTTDYRAPATAMVLHYRLGLSRNCFAFDVNLGCSGYTCGIEIASSILQKSEFDYALLLCGDTTAREQHPSRNTFEREFDKRLFGDCGTATLISKDEHSNDIRIIINTDGSGFKTIITPYEWYRNPDANNKTDSIMDGVEVFNFSTSKAPEMILELMKKSNTIPSDYDCLVLHQANELILDRIAKTTGFDAEKNLKSINKYGNTSSASIPTTLVYNYGNSVGGIFRCILCGFGVGLSWSAVDCYIDKKNILPQIFTDEYFEDGYSLQ